MEPVTGTRLRWDIADKVAREGGWTGDRVRRELPDVRISVMQYREDAIQYTGRLSGRQNEFATVTVEGRGSFEVAWPTIAYCLNHDKAILA